MIIRATKKVLTANKIKPQDVSNYNATNLNEWYVTQVSSGFKGKLFLAYVHNKSFLTIITEGKSIKQTFPVFKQRLIALTTRSNFPKALVEQLTDATKNLDAVSTTNDKSIVAKLNSVVDQIYWRCNAKTSYQEIDMDVEENILMNMLYGKNNKYFSPTSWWNNYIHGNDPLAPFSQLKEEQKIIAPSKLNKLGLTNEEELHMENQMLKMDLEQKFGKPININEQEDMPKLPLAIENEFLKHMSAFEHKFKTAKETTVYELLNKPKFKPTHTLTPKQLVTEIEKAFKLLSKHHIVVDFIAKYPAETMHEFLTVELMEKQIPDMHVPGFITHFIYEEFHPNHELSVMDSMHRFIRFLFDEDADLKHLKIMVSDNLIVNNKVIGYDELIDVISTFRLTNKYDSAMGFEIEDISFNPEFSSADAIGYIAFKNPIKGKRKIKLPFKFVLENTDDWWTINQLTFEPLN